MLIAIQIIGGFICLFFGGESLVRGAVKVAHHFKLSQLLIGITVVAYGTSSPELLITIQALLKESHEIALGNVLGSNVANIFLVLGLTAFIHPIKVPKNLVSFDIKYLLAASTALMLFIMLGAITRYEGVFLLFILLTYSYATFKQHSHKGKERDVLEDQVQEVEEQLNINITTPLAIILMIFGVILLALGGHILVLGASELARIFNVSEAAIAVSIVAIGGSAPEIATSVIAACRKHSNIAIGNVIGSNIFNTLGVIGIGSIITPIKTSLTLATFDIWVVIFATIILYVVCRLNYLISRSNAIFFLALYFLYILWQFL